MLLMAIIARVVICVVVVVCRVVQHARVHLIASVILIVWIMVMVIVIVIVIVRSGECAVAAVKAAATRSAISSRVATFIAAYGFLLFD